MPASDRAIYPRRILTLVCFSVRFVKCLDFKQCVRTQVVVGDCWVAAVYFGSRRRRMWGGRADLWGRRQLSNKPHVNPRQEWSGRRGSVEDPELISIHQFQDTWCQNKVGMREFFKIWFEIQTQKEQRAEGFCHLGSGSCRDWETRVGIMQHRICACPSPSLCFRAHQKLFKRILTNVQNECPKKNAIWVHRGIPKGRHQ